MSPSKKRVRRMFPVSKAFRSWLENYGDAPLAAKLGITSMTVTNWRVGRARPDVEKITAIIKLSGGALTLDQIITTSHALPIPRAPHAVSRAVDSPSPGSRSHDRPRRTARRD